MVAELHGSVQRRGAFFPRRAKHDGKKSVWALGNCQGARTSVEMV